MKPQRDSSSRKFIQDALAVFNDKLPIETAKTPPASWYVDSHFFTAERNAVFGASWQWVGFRDQLQQPGDYFTGQFLNWPYLVLLDAEHHLRAFFNICRHHGTCVAKGKGQTDSLVCPYHGWTYALNGRLIRAPKAGASEHLKDKTLGLIPVPLIQAGRFIGLWFGKDAPAQDAPLQTPVLEAMDHPDFQWVASKSYVMDCNWKVFVDNYLDGGYHVEFMHPALAAQLDLTSYRSEILANGVMQTCAAKDAPSDTSKRIGEQARYLWLPPNFCVNQYGNWLDTNWVVPLGPASCRIDFNFFHKGPIAAKNLAEALAGSDQVQQEDMEICDMVQNGLNSGVYDQGIYATRFERPMYHFHKWLAHQLKAYSREDPPTQP